MECERSVIEVKAHRPVVPSCYTFAQVPILSHRKMQAFGTKAGTVAYVHGSPLNPTGESDDRTPVTGTIGCSEVL